MFTWNFQYISKDKLAGTLNQLMLDSDKGDILIRIHTAIHTGDEAVDMARFIKSIVPDAHIFGTSTSAVINAGKLYFDQCVISVTQMSEGRVSSVLLPLQDRKGKTRDTDSLCADVKDVAVDNETRLLLTFMTGGYLDAYNFVDRCNKYFPKVQMIGGVTTTSEIAQKKYAGKGFVFNESGYSDCGMIFASFSGEKVESYTSYVSGAQSVGEELEITKAAGNRIVTIDGINAGEQYRRGVGEKITQDSSLAFLFPFVYSEYEDIPVMVGYSDDKLFANHNLETGKKIKRSFIFDRKNLSDNRSLFSRIEGFKKAETLFAYSCKDRASIYPNTVRWELSIYENSNICGCLTEGEITSVGETNVFSSCTFSVSVLGEKESVQLCNPYVFSHADSLSNDNRRLLDYIMEIETTSGKGENEDQHDELMTIVRECESRLLHFEDNDIPNGAAMNMDIKINGYDRVCLIDVLDTISMRTVFSESMIDMTYKSYVTKCSSFAREKGYRFYVLDKWQVAIGAPSFKASLQGFVRDMNKLYKGLSEASEDRIAIVPVFCVINECNVDNIKSIYNIARLDMMNKNVQFYVRDAQDDRIDEESIKERYRMVNVINYALANDKVIPYFQGIYDNKKHDIHHYESLMRLEDENGVIHYPGSFLEVARSFGLLYDSLSFSMISKVFDIFKDIKDKSVSINLSMRDVKNDELVEYIYEFLSTAKYPGNFIFEILENEDVNDYDALVRFVDKIHKLGGLISIDDFGSGYSNLQHIVSIHSDYIKIDGSIVRNCCKDQESENLVALISGWKNLSTREIQIVAEYVENEEIQKKLNRYGIDYSQGYLFSKPSPGLETEIND